MEIMDQSKSNYVKWQRAEQQRNKAYELSRKLNHCDQPLARLLLANILPGNCKMNVSAIKANSGRYSFTNPKS